MTESKQIQGFAEYAALVRQVRQESGLSLTQLAARSGLSRTTVYRWEHGQCYPWLPELERYLEVTRARPELARALIRGVNRPRTILQNSASLHLGMNFLLQALRLRAGRTTSDVANYVGVSLSAVQKWERGEGWPSRENLHRVCFYLSATVEELAALSQGPLAPEAESTYHLEMVEARLAARLNPLPAFAQDPLMDLKVTFLESRLVELIQNGVAPERHLNTLGHVRASYAQALQIWGRNGQALRVAQNAISQSPPTGYSEYLVRAQVVFSQIQTDLRRAPRKQIQVLLNLEAEVARHRPGRYYSFQPWIWATLADLFARSRRSKLAIDAIDRAADIERTYHRRPSMEVVRWKAKLLNNLGKPHEAERVALEGLAFPTSGQVEPPLPGLWLELATAKQHLGRHQEAIDALLVARDLATENALDFLMPVISKRMS